MDLLSGQRSRIQPLIAAHAAATDKMERVYQLRADITAMQYVLVDNVLSQNTSGDFLSDSVETALAQKRQSLAQSLEVPSISDIAITSTRHGYANQSTFQLSIQHPLNVAEVSVQFERDGDTNTGSNLSAYRSVGWATSIPFFTGKTGYSRDGSNEAFHNSKSYSIGVRARGPAGNTAIRRAQFNVSVGPQSSTSGNGPGDNILVADTSPPQTPIIFFDGIYESSTTQMLEGTPQTGFHPVTVTRFWTTDPTKIEFLVQARDPESDISSFEYAIGTALGATNIIDWSTLQGNRFVADGIDGNEAVFLRGASRVFTLTAGTQYYVSVRVTNG
jgi:hypothetical protein